MRGAGRAFCAGLDIKDHEGLKDAPFGGGFGFKDILLTFTFACAVALNRLSLCPQGAASGGGFAFALATDIKIAGESLKMNSAFIKLGLSSCDMG